MLYTVRKGAHYVARHKDALHLRLMLANLIVSLVPYQVFPQLRGVVYRAAGFSHIGNVHLLGSISLRGWGDIYSRLEIGDDTMINHSCELDLNGQLRIGQRVSLGNHVMIVTANHEVGDAHRRCGQLASRSVTIGDGAWVGARATILPGVTIGPGAVVAAGSVVASDVPANARVAGNPARVAGWLEA
jgi:maltose O-acetyltransferase